MTSTRPVLRKALRWGEITGAAADLGVFVPLSAALVLVNGVDPSGILVAAGLLLLGAGISFRIPFPVQPLKALSAVAVARAIDPGTIHAAGLEIGAFLLFFSLPGVADRLARLFAKPVVRSLQFGVGLLLVYASTTLLIRPPAIFAPYPPTGLLFLLGVSTLGVIAIAARSGRYGALLVPVGIGLGFSILSGRPAAPGMSLALPGIHFPSMGQFSSAFLLLVIPQIPLTFGNAVVAVSDLAGEYFGERARRVTPRRVCLSAGLGNVFSSIAGGMPMCHGAGGLSAHYRLGARSSAMNMLLGSVFLLGGLFFAPHVLRLFGLLPLWALAASLAFAGIHHALLVFDLRGRALGLALGSGLAGALCGNLAITTAVSLGLYHGAGALRRARPAMGEAP